MKDKEKIEAAIELAFEFGDIDGGHHKMWVIDQMLRALTGNEYDEIVRKANHGEDGPDTYEWPLGIPP